MIEITPVGVIASNVESSTTFYRQVLGINRVQNLGNFEGMPVLRLESPNIEIDSTIIATFDRPGKSVREPSQRLRLICDLQKTLTAIKAAGIAIEETNGRCSFTDMNGLIWYLSDNQGRNLDS